MLTEAHAQDLKVVITSSGHGGNFLVGQGDRIFAGEGACFGHRVECQRSTKVSKL